MKLLTWTVVTLILLPLCFASTAVNPVSGIEVVVQAVDPTNSSATIQVTNRSSKNVTGFVILAMGTHVSGKIDRDEHGKDYGPKIAYDKSGLLGPGKTAQVKVAFSEKKNDPLRSVEAKVVVVIFSDQTAEATDERSFEHHMRTRKSASNSIQETASIIKSSLSDPSDEHPSIKAIALLKDAEASDKANKEEKITGFFVEAQRVMGSASKYAGQASISEREFMKNYLAETEAKAASYVEYASVRRIK